MGGEASFTARPNGKEFVVVAYHSRGYPRREVRLYKFVFLDSAERYCALLQRQYHKPSGAVKGKQPTL